MTYRRWSDHPEMALEVTLNSHGFHARLLHGASLSWSIGYSGCDEAPISDYVVETDNALYEAMNKLIERLRARDNERS